MSQNLILEKLPTPVKNLVVALTEDGQQLMGRSDDDQVQVAQWIEKIADGSVGKDNVQDLNAQLVPRTFLVSNYFTAADAALYGTLYPVVSKFDPKQYYSHPALTRYFDHIQSQPAVRKAAESLAPDFSLVTFDLDNSPKIERTTESTSTKDKTAKKKLSEKEPEQPAIAPLKEATHETKEKKKKEKKPAAAANEAPTKTQAKAAADDSGPPVPSMIDLRVGKIVEVTKHPDADGLYVEKIDVGEATGPRTVVSGLVHYIPIEEMRDKRLLVVCNLKPAAMRGIKSFGMVLAATSKNGKADGVELVEPPLESEPGERVYFEGAEFENAVALTQLNPKKKIFEAIQPGFITLDTKEAAWINPETKGVHRIRTKHGFCLAPTLIGASLS